MLDLLMKMLAMNSAGRANRGSMILCPMNAAAYREAATATPVPMLMPELTQNLVDASVADDIPFTVANGAAAANALVMSKLAPCVQIEF